MFSAAGEGCGRTYIAGRTARNHARNRLMISVQGDTPDDCACDVEHGDVFWCHYVNPMTSPATAARGSQPADHIVQFFDRYESLADAVAAFVGEGLAHDDAVLVVMRPELWNLTAARLDREYALGRAIASGQLTVRDADRTLKQFMRNGFLSDVL